MSQCNQTQDFQTLILCLLTAASLQWGVASFCRPLQYILQTGLFHQFPLPPSIPPSRTPHTQRACAPGQDSGHCAQLSFRVASESAGCDFRLARVIIRLSYMGIIREAIISQYSHILVSFQSNYGGKLSAFMRIV